MLLILTTKSLMKITFKKGKFLLLKIYSRNISNSQSQISQSQSNTNRDKSNDEFFPDQMKVKVIRDFSSNDVSHNFIQLTKNRQIF